MFFFSSLKQAHTKSNIKAKQILLWENVYIGFIIKSLINYHFLIKFINTKQKLYQET